MQELRNYALHYQRVPIGTSTLQLPDGTLENVTFLETAILLEWDGWKKSIRESLINRRIPIPVRIVVDEYMSRANDLYDWFHATTLKQHADSLREYHEERQRYKEWLKRRPRNEIFSPTEGWVVYADEEPPTLSAGPRCSRLGVIVRCWRLLRALAVGMGPRRPESGWMAVSTTGPRPVGGW